MIHLSKIRPPGALCTIAEASGVFGAIFLFAALEQWSAPARSDISPAPSALIMKLRDIVERDGAPGVTAMAFHKGRLLYRADIGDIKPGAQFPVASASKWMAAALLMTLVDDGKLSLDEPIGLRLPQFEGRSGAITLRQLLSFTSGQGSLRGLFDIAQEARMTLSESAKRIAARPLEDPPGAVFKYGGPSLQVAGALAERTTGKSWAALFREKLAEPLGLTHSYWTNVLEPNLDPALVANPNLQAGLVTTAEDYSMFLTMIAENGSYGGRQILSPTAVETLEKAQTLNATFGYLPPGVPNKVHYALGNWCETVATDGACTLVSSPGAYGTYPWIDRKSGLYGVFFMRYRLPLVADRLREARSVILDSYDPFSTSEAGRASDDAE